jgi:DNA-binding transcriptional MerR regulator
MTQTGVPIGVASARSGVKVPTIRYYQEIGLLPQPRRTSNNWRQYEPADIRRLVLIRHARELGFDIGAIRALLVLLDSPDEPCVEADAIARARLAELQRRINGLTLLRTELERIVEKCSLGRVAECRVIGALTGDLGGDFRS